MSTDKNQNSEQIARDKIDQMLVETGWLVQLKDKLNWSAGTGVGLRETNIESRMNAYKDVIEAIGGEE